MTTVVVLGANGFVGRGVVPALAASGASVRAVVRSNTPGDDVAGPGDLMRLDSLFDQAALRQAIDGADVVVHLVAVAHRGGAADEYRRVNVELTSSVVRCCEEVEVNCLVFTSSIKAVSEESAAPLAEDVQPRPLDEYGRSKLEAERIVSGSSVRTVILRPPLVHGPGVKGNMLRLLSALERGIPLPLATASAPRSVIGLANLADAVVEVGLRAPAAHGTYHVTDDADITVRDLLRELGAALGHPARLLPVPPGVLLQLGRLVGREEEVRRLVRPLRVSMKRITTELGWAPPIGRGQGLKEMAAWFAGRPR